MSKKIQKKSPQKSQKIPKIHKKKPKPIRKFKIHKNLKKCQKSKKITFFFKKNLKILKIFLLTQKKRLFSYFCQLRTALPLSNIGFTFHVITTRHHKTSWNNEPPNINKINKIQTSLSFWRQRDGYNLTTFFAIQNPNGTQMEMERSGLMFENFILEKV